MVSSIAWRGPDPALRLADRVMRDNRVENAGALYRENLATFLFNGLGRHGVRHMLQARGPLTPEVLRAHRLKLAAHRWLDKIDRDVAQPFQDVDVFRHLQTLEGQFHETVRTLAQWGDGKSYRILINGSLCKGRMGSNSDIDVTVETADPQLRERIRQATGDSWKGNISVIVSNPRPDQEALTRLAMGPSLDLGDGQVALDNPHLLYDYYQDVMRQKGYALAPGPEGLPVVVGVPQAGRRHRESELLFEKFWEKCRPDAGHQGFLRAKAVLAAAVYRLLPVPLAGGVVRAGMGLLVPTRP